MKISEDKKEEMTHAKYSQIIPPNLNKEKKDLSNSEFSIFTGIEEKNPTKSQISLREEESKRLNIIYDKNNTFIEDKNINDIKAGKYKISNKQNNYFIDLPSDFMRSQIVSMKEGKPEFKGGDIMDKIEEKKKEEGEVEENINMKNSNNNENINNNLDDDYEIDLESLGNIENEIKREDNLYKEEMINKINDDNKFKEEKKEKEKENDIKNKNKDNNINHSDENVIKEDMLDKKHKVSEMIVEENKRKDNDDFEIEIDGFSGENNFKKEKGKHKQKTKHHKNHKIKNHNSANNSNVKEEEENPSKMNTITTLYINGLNSNEYFLGQIIEKGPNFPSTLGIVKYMDLVLFSENYFGEKLDFNTISSKDDFQKIIKVIPEGNKKYIFSKDNPTTSDISHEENDLIILHGKGGIETYYYIMKLTGEINGVSEYTIYKVKNNKKIISHFKDSIGIYNDDSNDYLEDGGLNSENINYNIVEKPNIKYLIMPGQQFLTKYRKLIKKEKDVELKKKEIEQINNYNLSFDKNYSLLREEYDKKISEKNLEIEKKKNNIESIKESINKQSQKEKKLIEELNKLSEERKKVKELEEIWKTKLNNGRKRLREFANNPTGYFNETNIKREKDIDEDLNEYNYENDENIKISKEKLNVAKEKLKKLKENIFCINCNKNRREVIFCGCKHLMLCKNCFEKSLEDKKKLKANCPSCKMLCKKFFFISYED